jgi:hypothetical protein
LRYFRLVGRVCGKELASKDQGIDNDGTIMVVSAGPKKCAVAVTILPRPIAEPLHDLRLGHLAWDGKIPLQTVLRGDGGKEIIHRSSTDALQHGLAIGIRLR